jgi:hypothetical protein
VKVVSLNKARKVSERVKAKVQADANAVKFGRTKGEKAAEAAQSEDARRFLDARRIEP